MRRLAIFAHFDKDNIIDDYVIFYLKQLKRIADNIIFVSCCNLNKTEIKKLTTLAIPVIEQHDEYDFGSYKRGFLYAKENNLLNVDEVIFANDSCFGPLKPLDEMFFNMENNDCDFWGITKNKIGIKKNSENKFPPCIRPHIQSYFIVLRKSVFTSETFEEFINSIKKEEFKNDIIEKYEIGLSEKLISAGFKDDFYIKDFYGENNATIIRWKDLIETSNFPFIKCSLMRLENRYETTVSDWEKYIKKFNYNKELISNNLKRTSSKKFKKHLIPSKIRYNLFVKIANLPTKQRYIAVKFLKIFKIFVD